MQNQIIACRVLVIGEMCDTDFRSAAARYLKLLKNIARADFIEIPEPRNLKSFPPEKVRQKNSELLRARLDTKASKNSCLIALDTGGQEYRSEDFAKFLNDRGVVGGAELIFMIGGPEGLAKDFVLDCDESISLGKMTLPHELAAVVLLEQLYRGISILQGRSYHR